MLSELVVVIPAYEPNKLMLDLIDDLNQYFDDCSIVIVNDGSKKADETFLKASQVNNVTIVNHEVNKGKGAALKTAYNFISNYDNEKHIIVTADADGQHRPEDIYKVTKRYKELNKGVVLGSRQFENEVPLRSRFGNDVTRFLYRLFNNKIITDNQTGLRAFGSDLLPFMMSISGDRYEYEMNVLVECSRQDVEINEVKIATVYINNNESSHFRPVRDFLKICKNMVKYVLPYVITFIINIGLFIGLYHIFKNNTDLSVSNNVLFSGLISCSVGALFNMLMNFFGVFYGNKYLLKIQSKRRKYLLLGTASIAVNAFTVFGLYHLADTVFGAKGITEAGLLIITLLANYFLVPKAKIK